MTRLIMCFAVIVMALGLVDKTHAQDSVDALIKNLESKKSEVRLESLRKLVDLGPNAAPATARLLDLLTKFDEEESALAIVALGKIGKPAVPGLVKLLTHEDEMTRHYAVWALGLVGIPAKDAAPTLIKLLTSDPDTDVRAKAAFALTLIVPGDPAALKAMAKVLDEAEDCYPPASDVAAQLEHWGEPAIPILGKALRMPNSHWGVQHSLAHLLDKRQTKSAAEAMRPFALDAFANAWGDPSSDGTSFGMRELWQSKGMSHVLATLGYGVVKPLETPLRGKDTKERKRALMTMLRMAHTLVKNGDAPELADQIVKQIVPFCQSEDLELRKLAVTNIPFTKASEAALRTALLDDDRDMKEAAMNRLRRADDDGGILDAALSELRKRLHKTTGMEQIYTAAWFVQTEEAQTILRAYLGGKDAALRREAAFVLGEVPTPILVASLKSENPAQRRRAVEWLGKREDAAHVPLFLDLLKDKDALTRQHAIYALAPHASENRQDIVTAVKPLLQDPDWRTRSAAVSCLTRCPKSALPALVQACAVEKETSIIQDQVLRFLMERDDPSSIEAILHLAARKDGVWVRFALIHKDTKKYFPKVLAIDCNHDSILKKTIAEMPKAPATLDEAMTGLSVRLKVNDRAVQWRAAYSVRRIANYFQNHPSPAFLPGLEAADYALEKLKPALLDKDPAVRRNAVFLLWQLDSMQTDFWHMFRGRKYVEITKQVEATGETIRALLNTARGDPELAIRRLARSKIRSEALPADFK